MKNALFLVLSICTVLTSANAQYGDRRDDRRRDDKYIDSDALENMALQSLENDLKRLINEIRNNGNYSYGDRGNRGAVGAVDILSVALSMENASRNLRALTRGERTRRSEPGIRAETQSLNMSAVSMINAIPRLARSSANLIDNLLEVIKSVGAVELALKAPRSAGPSPIVIEPPVYGGRAAYCSLSFTNSWGSAFLASGEGYNPSQASANLYNNCGMIGGTAGNISNAAVCQSKIAQAKCLDVVDMARVQNAGSRFTACTMTFTNSWGSGFTTNGAGQNMVDAISVLWDSCKNMGGTAGNITNAEVCRHAIANQRFSCTVH